MSCFLQIFKAQNTFEIKMVEVGDYNTIVNITNQDPSMPKMSSKKDFPYFAKNFRLSWSQSG